MSGEGESYRAFFEGMEQGAFYQLADGTLVDVNPAALELFGLAREEFLGRTSRHPGWKVVDEHGADLPPERYPSMVALAAGEPVRGVVVGVFNPRRQAFVWLSIGAVPEFRPGEARPWRVLATLHDVTAHRELQQRVSRVAREWQATFDAAADAICVLDPDQRILRANRAMAELAGTVPGVLVGRHCWEVMHGTTEPIPGCPVPRMLQSRGRESTEITVGDRTFEDTVDPILDAGGALAGVAHIVRDVTARRRDEAALRLSEARLRAAQRTARMGSWTYEPATGRLWWSEELHRIFAVDPREGPVSVGLFLSRVHPDDRARLEREIAGARPPQSAYRILLPGGSIRHIQEKVEALLDDAGSPVAYEGTAQDVTEGTRAEELLRARVVLSELGSRAGVEALARAGLDAAERLTGSAIGFFHLVDADEEHLTLTAWSTRTLAEACRAEGAGSHYPVSAAGVWVDCLRERAPVIHNDYAALPHRKGLPPGHAAVVRELTIPVVREGRVVAVLGVGNKPAPYGPEDVAMALALASITMDFVERRQAADALRELNETLERRVAARTAELKAAYRELEAFSYTAAHDLRTPVRGIVSFAQILEQDHAAGLDADGRECLARVRAAAVRLGRLIDELLDFARIGREELQRLPVDLGRVAAEVVAALREREPARRVAVSIAPVAAVRGDPRLLRLALHNLLANAWKFTGATPGAAVEFGEGPGAGDERVFFVRDNGAGFDPARAARLFEVFQRLHGPEEFPGSGMGLATVRRVVERHGGRVWAEGAPGAGATFFFALPGGEGALSAGA